MKIFWNSFRMFIWMTVLTGLLYPLIVTGISLLTMHESAYGSFVKSKEGNIVGSQLIGQKFDKAIYFWGRPSFVDYNPLPSGASNLGPTSAALKAVIEKRKAAIRLTHRETIPSELLFASGSGLDPHISPATAYFQIDRIAKARKMDPNTARGQLKHFVDQLTEERFFGFIGERCVNVLLLNMALDEFLNHGDTETQR